MTTRSSSRATRALNSNERISFVDLSHEKNDDDSPPSATRSTRNRSAAQNKKKKKKKKRRRSSRVSNSNNNKKKKGNNDKSGKNHDDSDSSNSSRSSSSAGGASKDKNENEDDDDEDEVEILDSAQVFASSARLVPCPPVPGSATSSNNDDDDDDIQVVGTVGQVRLPHLRQDCTEKPFDGKAKGSNSKNSEICDKCYCWVCDVPASECLQWTTTTLTQKAHCNAFNKSGYWKRQRQLFKDKASGSNNKDAPGQRTATDGIASTQRHDTSVLPPPPPPQPRRINHAGADVPPPPPPPPPRQPTNSQGVSNQAVIHNTPAYYQLQQLQQQIQQQLQQQIQGLQTMAPSNNNNNNNSLAGYFPSMPPPPPPALPPFTAMPYYYNAPVACHPGSNQYMHQNQYQQQQQQQPAMSVPFVGPMMTMPWSNTGAMSTVTNYPSNTYPNQSYNMANQYPQYQQQQQQQPIQGNFYYPPPPPPPPPPPHTGHYY